MNSSEKFEWIYENYRIGMLAVAYSILKNGDVSEDIVHKAFIKIMEKIDILEIDDKRTKAYCMITAKNLSLNHCKREQRFQMESIDLYENKILDFESSQIINNVEEHMMYEDLIAELDLLPEIQRQVFWMRSNYGFSFKVIGDMLNITPTNARKIHSRAKKKLRGIMEGKDYSYE